MPGVVNDKLVHLVIDRYAGHTGVISTPVLGACTVRFSESIMVLPLKMYILGDAVGNAEYAVPGPELPQSP